MKNKYVIFLAFVLGHMLSGGASSEMSNETERKLVDKFDPEFADIAPYIHGSTLTPENATRRFRAIIRRLSRLQEKLVKTLYLVKDYIVYHQKRANPEEGEEESTDYSTTEYQSNSTQNLRSPVDSLNQRYPTPDNNDPYSNTSIMRDLRQLLSTPFPTPSMETVDQPILHNYGEIKGGDSDFKQINDPQLEISQVNSLGHN